MDKVKLLFARNLISRKTPQSPQQSLTFFVQVENFAYDKEIFIKWAGEDAYWHTLPAFFHCNVDAGSEYWIAQIDFTQTLEQSLPGNIQFAVCYRAAGKEYWDNNLGKNHSIHADSGIVVGAGHPVLNTSFDYRLSHHERRFPISVAVDKHLDAQSVSIHWTNDDWKTTHQSPCHFSRNYWNAEHQSNARNPNQYGCQIWNGALKLDDAYRVRYKIVCETPKGIVRDDNAGLNYTIQRRPLKVMILNLHCYQEDDQDYKLSQIAKAIDELDVDIVCLQEVAENWNDGRGDWESNSARIINSRLKSPYQLVTDWSHLGFNRYREGVAILSRHTIERHEGRYVSRSHDPFSIHARKVVMAQIRVPTVGLINVFSSHLSWLVDGFPEQFENLRQWAASERNSLIKATLLCGDFNVKAGSKGYQQVVDSREYDDQYLAIHSPQIFRKIFDSREPARHRFLERDHRIDFVFLRKGSALVATAGQMIFTDQDYGKVSDHFGYLMTFEPK